MVKGTLVCDTTGTLNGNSDLVDSTLVPLNATGDANFEGNLGPLPATLYIAAGIYREERNWARQLEATWAERGRRAAGCGAPIKRGLLTSAGVALVYSSEPSFSPNIARRTSGIGGPP
jgi:hypothetical protein